MCHDVHAMEDCGMCRVGSNQNVSSEVAHSQCLQNTGAAQIMREDEVLSTGALEEDMPG